MALWLVAVCGDRRASMTFSWLHMMSISTSCSSHVSLERSGSTWTKFQTQCNLRKRKKMPVSYKLSEASRLNSLFCLCLIPKLSKSMAQPDCCCRLTRAEIKGIVACGCVWRPLSLHDILLIPYDVHLHFLLFTSFCWELCEIIRFVLENSICLFETLESRERLHAQSAQVNSYSEMPEILDFLDFAPGLCQLRICGKLQEVEGIT